MKDEYGWRGSMLILSGILANMCVVAMVLFPISHFQVPQPNKTKSKTVRQPKTSSSNSTSDVTPMDDDVFDGGDVIKNVANEKEELFSAPQLGKENQEIKRKGSFSVVRNLVRHPWLRRKSSFAVSQMARQEYDTTNRRVDAVLECVDEKSQEVCLQVPIILYPSGFVELGSCYVYLKLKDIRHCRTVLKTNKK